jgi:acyl-homoserine lactone synthase
MLSPDSPDVIYQGAEQMIQVINLNNMHGHHLLMDEMFVARKKIFIDRMGWKIRHHRDREFDQFDDEWAEYIVVQDPDTGGHLASARLLRTDRPHILDTLFATLCEAAIPTGPSIRELTRFCITPNGNARYRLELRNRLFSALVDYGLMHGIDSYTGVTHFSFLSQVLSLGWRCDMLGLPRETDAGTLGAVQAHMNADTIGMMRRADTYRSTRMEPFDTVSLAA